MFLVEFVDCAAFDFLRVCLEHGAKPAAFKFRMAAAEGAGLHSPGCGVWPFGHVACVSDMDSGFHGFSKWGRGGRTRAGVVGFRR